jgi:hypothetical protein
MNIYRKVLTKNQIQTQSDIIRNNLLAHYGGVWVDSTLYCLQSLDSWLLSRMSTGFLLYTTRNSKFNYFTGISNWFLAASKDSFVMNTFNDYFNNFWEGKEGLVISTSNHKDPNYFHYHILFMKMYADNSCIRDHIDCMPFVSAKSVKKFKSIKQLANLIIQMIYLY